MHRGEWRTFRSIWATAKHHIDWSQKATERMNGNAAGSSRLNTGPIRTLKEKACVWYTSLWKTNGEKRWRQLKYRLGELTETGAYMSTQREVFEGQKTARRAKRGGLWKGGPGVLPRKFSKTCIANGAIWVIPELYLSIQLGYIVMQFESKVSFLNL